MEHIYNCPPRCEKCFELHYASADCVLHDTGTLELDLKLAVNQPVIVAAAYRHRTDGRVGVLNAANMRGIGMVQLFMEDDPQWIWKGNLENFHFYWKLEEPKRIVDSKEFWDSINYQRDDENDDKW